VDKKSNFEVNRTHLPILRSGNVYMFMFLTVVLSSITTDLQWSDLQSKEVKLSLCFN